MTKWVLIGSTEDDIVEEESIVDMDHAKYYVYLKEDDGRCITYNHVRYFHEDGAGHLIDACFKFDTVTETRNMWDDDKGRRHDAAFRPLKLGLFEAVT